MHTEINLLNISFCSHSVKKLSLIALTLLEYRLQDHILHLIEQMRSLKWNVKDMAQIETYNVFFCDIMLGSWFLFKKLQ